ncbi:MAG TPA: hypothetical protein VL326_07925 [Kofleriaceae bacterium]|jgi:hypothetical protein|nr:hypothetical protein [Kofleriaceae bacterium]
MLIESPTQVDVDAGPLIFLAGPVSWGAGAWHERAIDLIAKLDARVHVATPRRDPATSAELWNLREDTAGAPFDEAAYNQQQDWETKYLRLAGATGAVMFWLARERNHRCERPHAQTTRFELAEWKERAARDGAHLVVGIEDGFSGGRYIRRRFAQDCPAVPVCDTLEATCRAAIALCTT